MARVVKGILVLGLLFTLTACVSRYSTIRCRDGVILKDNELNQEITVAVHGAEFLGKSAGAFVYEKGKDTITIWTEDVTENRQATKKPFLYKKDGVCYLSHVEQYIFNDRQLVVVYLDNSALTPSECGTVEDIDDFYARYPVKGERLLAKIAGTVEIIR